jgi:hypothetical protein
LRMFRFEQEQWQLIGVMNDSQGFRLHTWDDGSGMGLYATGQFTAINGIPFRGIARWTGSEWIDPFPPQYRVGDMTDAVVYDDGTGPAVYMIASIREDFQWVGSGQVLRWDGSTLTGVGGPIAPPGSVISRRGLHVMRHGERDSLFIIGGFPDVNGITGSPNIARYDGQWHVMNGGLRGGSAWAVTSMETPQGMSLMVMGSFETAGGGHSPYLAQWVACPNCYANCDSSTRTPRLNIDDFTCFISKFAAGDPYANCTQSTIQPFLTVDDFVCYINKFAMGCE